jgi:twitching motility protein PilU
LIKAGNITEMKEVMEKSEAIGMQTFDMDLYNLYKSGKISRDEALKNADSENNLSLKIGFGDDGDSQASVTG